MRGRYSSDWQSAAMFTGFIKQRQQRYPMARSDSRCLCSAGVLPHSRQVRMAPLRLCVGKGFSFMFVGSIGSASISARGRTRATALVQSFAAVVSHEGVGDDLGKLFGKLGRD